MDIFNLYYLYNDEYRMCDAALQWVRLLPIMMKDIYCIDRKCS
jgi:hypothetical protein